LCLPAADPIEINATSAAANDAAVKSRLIRFLPSWLKSRETI
jgi:hypothetical protein